MNEKEAKKFLTSTFKYYYHEKAKGYLEALEKAKLLENALRRCLDTCCEERTAEYNACQEGKQVLAKWEKIK